MAAKFSQAKSANNLFAEVIRTLHQVTGPDKKEWYTALCPFHNDQNHPNLRLREKGFRCLACDRKGSIKDLAQYLGIAVEKNRPSGLTLKELAEYKGIPKSFLARLGINDGYSGSSKCRRPCVDIPFMDASGQVVAIQKRLNLSQSPRFFWRRGDHPSLYGLWKINDFQSKGYVVIVEGPSDCWTLWQHGIPALGLPGAATWKPEYVQYLKGLSVYLWVEPDTGGNTLLKAVSATIPDIRVIQAPAEFKDPSALYLSNQSNFVQSFKNILAGARSACDLSSEINNREASQFSRQAAGLVHNPELVERLKAAIRDIGYAGDTRPALFAYLALTSRLLDRPLNIIFVAQSGSGKNASIEYVLPFFPEEAYYLIRASSPMALVYSNQEFQHRMVILWEADSLPEDGPAASAIRSLMSDQRIEYQVVEKNDSGKMQVREIKKEGPTGIITTSTRPLQEQASTRMLMISITDSTEQTREVLKAIASKETIPASSSDLSDWIALQKWLALAGEKRVVVPFAGILAEKIKTQDVRIRRDFTQLLTVIKVFAFMYQAQRNKDDRGRVLAAIADYEMAKWLLEEVFTTSVTGGLTPAIKETVQAVTALYKENTPVTFRQLQEYLEISKSTISYRVERAINGGWLINKASKLGTSAQLEPGLPLPDETILPDINDLFVCVTLPENHSNTRTPPPNPPDLASKSSPEVFEKAFEHPFEQFERSEGFERSFEHLPTKDSEAKLGPEKPGVRVFEPNSEDTTHTKHKTENSAEKGTSWEMEL